MSWKFPLEILAYCCTNNSKGQQCLVVHTMGGLIFVLPLLEASSESATEENLVGKKRKLTSDVPPSKRSKSNAETATVLSKADGLYGVCKRRSRANNSKYDGTAMVPIPGGFLLVSSSLLRLYILDDETPKLSSTIHTESNPSNILCMEFLFRSNRIDCVGQSLHSELHSKGAYNNFHHENVTLLSDSLYNLLFDNELCVRQSPTLTFENLLATTHCNVFVRARNNQLLSGSTAKEDIWNDSHWAEALHFFL